MKGSLVNNSDIFRICLDLVTKREIGMMELGDTLMGHPLRSTDTAHVFIDTNAEAARQRILKPKTVLENARDNQQQNVQAFVNNWTDHYYPQRPSELENCSLFNVRVYFKKAGEKNEGGGNVADEANEAQEDAEVDI